MNRDEFFEMDAPEAVKELNALVAAGKTTDEALEECGLTLADLMKAQIFDVDGEFIARAWAGYTSTKRTGNEAGDTAQGVGNSDPTKGFAGI